MKKSFLILLSAVIIMFSACSGNKETADSPQASAPSVQTIAPITDNTNLPESVTTTIGENTNASESSNSKTKKQNSSRKKTKKKQQKTKETIYEIRINYKSLADFKVKVQKYKDFATLMKSVDADENNNCLYPFRQENLWMIFEDNKAYAPIFPKGASYVRSSLSSRGYFEFDFIDDDEMEQNLKIYTINSNESLKTSKYNLSFKSEQGTDIYKNTDKKYCWFLDDKYVVVYSGKDKDFINELYFETIYIE